MDTKSAYIFDLDDTLIKTSAVIIIRNRNTGEELRRIPTSEYNSVENHSVFLTDTETEMFDFSEFNNPDLLSNEQVSGYFENFKQVLTDGEDVYIITSREHTEHIRIWLSKHLDVIPENLKIFCTSYDGYPFTGTDAQKKRKTLKCLVEQFGYNRFHIWDDSDANINAMKQLVDHNVTVIDEIRLTKYEKPSIKDLCNRRYKYNIDIVKSGYLEFIDSVYPGVKDKVSEYIESHKDMRFGQIICNYLCGDYQNEDRSEKTYGIMNTLFFDCKCDPFYEESYETLARLSKSKS